MNEISVPFFCNEGPEAKKNTLVVMWGIAQTSNNLLFQLFFKLTRPIFFLNDPLLIQTSTYTFTICLHVKNVMSGQNLNSL